MRARAAALYRAWRDLRRFRSLEPRERAIVFYAEDLASRVHFQELIAELTGPLARDLCYLTSSPDDPLLRGDEPRIRGFYVGSGALRTAAFLEMQAGVVVMTLPELGAHYLRRSASDPGVHYAYLFHSIVSTHMVYRKGAYDHYDSILCVGPHHEAEIRAAERVYALPEKRLVACGYGRLDALLRAAAAAGDPATPSTPPGEGGSRHVLVAPSWGPEGLLESRGPELVRALLDAGFRVTVRPHPVTRTRWPRAIASLREAFGGHPGFALEADVASQSSLLAADAMVSDWSGAALEFAFAFERPVVFADVPRKVNNPDYGDIPLEPVEVSLRGEIGAVVPADRLGEVPGAVERLCAEPEALRARIREARARVVHNPGESGRAGARHVAALADAYLERLEGPAAR